MATQVLKTINYYNPISSKREPFVISTDQVRAGEEQSLTEVIDTFQTMTEGLDTDTSIATVTNNLDSRLSTVETNEVQSVVLDGVTQAKANNVVTLDLSSYVKKSENQAAVHYRGTINSVADLPATGNTVGDLYNVRTAGGTDASGIAIKAGDNVIFNESGGWDVQSGTVDLSAYLTSSTAALTYVPKEAGKGLSTNDLTDDLVNKINAAASGGITNIKINSVSQTVTNNTVDIDLSDYVTKETGKGLSTNDLTNELVNTISDTAVTAGTALQGISIDGVNQTITSNVAQLSLNNYVQKETGKGLSTNDLTNELVDKINGDVVGVSVNGVEQAKNSDNVVDIDLSNYVQKETGKGLSTNDLTSELVNTISDTAVTAGTALQGISIDGVTQTVTSNVAQLSLSNYVQKETGKGLSTNDLTDELVTKINDSTSNGITGVTINSVAQTVSSNVVDLDLSDYVTKETGKGLSTNDLTDSLVDTISDTAVTAGTALQGIEIDGVSQTVTNNVAQLSLANYATTSAVSANYVAKEAGKGLTTNDFDNDYKGKVDTAIQGVSVNDVPLTATSGVVNIDMSQYEPKLATSSTAGGVVVGSGISLDGSTGTISVPEATQSSAGLLSANDKKKVDYLIDPDGYDPVTELDLTGFVVGDYNSDTQTTTSYVLEEGDERAKAYLKLPIATSTHVGGIKIGSGIVVDSSGTASVTIPTSVASAGYATNAGSAASANSSVYANSSVSAGYATSANSAATAGTATNATNATNATYAASATTAPNYLPLSGGTVSGDLQVSGAIRAGTASGSGTRLLIGDGNYCYISEPTDDNMTIHVNSNKNLNLEGNVQINGTNIGSITVASATNANYATTAGTATNATNANSAVYANVTKPDHKSYGNGNASLSSWGWSLESAFNVANSTGFSNFTMYWFWAGDMAGSAASWYGYQTNHGSNQWMQVAWVYYGSVFCMRTYSNSVWNDWYKYVPAYTKDSGNYTAEGWKLNGTFATAVKESITSWTIPSATHATIAGSCTGNAATATSCTGNAATATKASSCTGNAATATTAASCTGNAATATKWASAWRISGIAFQGGANATHCGYCSTAAATADKTVAIANYTSLINNTFVIVYFRYQNSAANPTLNVNSTGAAQIKIGNTAISGAFLASTYCPVTLMYYGSYWHICSVNPKS